MKITIKQLKQLIKEQIEEGHLPDERLVNRLADKARTAQTKYDSNRSTEDRTDAVEKYKNRGNPTDDDIEQRKQLVAKKTATANSMASVKADKKAKMEADEVARKADFAKRNSLSGRIKGMFGLEEQVEETTETGQSGSDDKNELFDMIHEYGGSCAVDFRSADTRKRWNLIVQKVDSIFARIED